MVESKQNDSRYCISNGLLYEKISKVDDLGLLLIPEKLRDEVVHFAHDCVMAGHLGISKGTAFLFSRFGTSCK